MFKMDTVQAEREDTAGIRAGGKARVSASPTEVRHVEVLVMEQQLALPNLGELDPYLQTTTQRPSRHLSPVRAAVTRDFPEPGSSELPCRGSAGRAD